MFETAISYGPPSHRMWTTCMGMTGQAILVACAIVIPLWFPAALPRPESLVAWLTAPPMPVPPVAQQAIVAAPKMLPFQYVGPGLHAPLNIPTRVVMIEDPPLPPGAVAYSVGKGIGDFMQAILTPPAPASAAAPVVHAAQSVVPAPVRVRVGTGVKPAEVLSRVIPVYPPLARQARISGVVELEGVVGVDGHIRELKVLNGHPLLIRAALEAVAQWVFRPTLLNGEPVEIVQSVVVHFNLQ